MKYKINTFLVIVIVIVLLIIGVGGYYLAGSLDEESSNQNINYNEPSLDTAQDDFVEIDNVLDTLP